MYQKIERTGFSEQKAWLANVVWTMGNHQLIYQHQDAKDGARNDLRHGSYLGDVWKKYKVL